MPPSWSAVERVDPPPRRKSCAACIKAKRRCSQDAPSCQRCQQRRLECKYPAGSRPKRYSPEHSSPKLTTATPGAERLVNAPTPCSGTIHTPPAETPPLFVLPSELSPIALQMPFDSSSAEDTPQSQSEGSTPTTGQANYIQPPDSGVVPVPHASSSGSNESLAVSPPARPTIEVADRITYAMKVRLQWALDTISFAVNQMVLECSTPWSHPHLYEREMPRAMQDAQAFCALYINKTPANSLMVLRLIQSRAEELVSDPSPNTPLEALARAQAILLYQIIRFFDGDISLRAGAERGMRAMEESGLSLMAFIAFAEGTFDNSGFTLPGVPMPSAPGPEVAIHHCAPQDIRAFWETWVFQESARRTFLMTFFFLRIYEITKGEHGADPRGRCDGKLGLFHSFTASAHLWMAKDFVDFAAAWKTKRHFVIKNADFSELLADGQADDMDAWAKIIFSATRGIDEAKAWLTMRGGSL